jgi:3-hydroxyethyl bacteriochlorophyllide a dehydrogenase
MKTLAVLFDAPRQLALRDLELTPMSAGEVAVETRWSGVSTGTERLLYQGEMPAFPGMGYPLVPGYESVGRIVDAGPDARHRIGDWVFVPGARCYADARGLFGGAAARLVVASERAHAIPESLGADGVLVALAATALHMMSGHAPPDLIVGHGVLGRLLARLTLAWGAPAPIVWEASAARSNGAEGYEVVAPGADGRRDYRAIYDVSGDGGLLDTLVGRLARGGDIVLGGFYKTRLSFDFAPAFQREARIRVAAEWQPDDLAEVLAAISGGTLGLGGLLTTLKPANDAADAYRTAFDDAACLKMALDWRDVA